MELALLIFLQVEIPGHSGKQEQKKQRRKNIFFSLRAINFTISQIVVVMAGGKKRKEKKKKAVIKIDGAKKKSAHFQPFSSSSSFRRFNAQVRFGNRQCEIYWRKSKE